MPSVWEGELGNHAASDICQFAPFAIQRLHSPGDVEMVQYFSLDLSYLVDEHSCQSHRFPAGSHVGTWSHLDISFQGQKGSGSTWIDAKT